MPPAKEKDTRTAAELFLDLADLSERESRNFRRLAELAAETPNEAVSVFEIA
jgi:hypothetical protein